MEKIVIFGAGGHAKVIIDIIEKTGRFKIEAILDRDPGLASFLGYPVFTESQIATLEAKAGVIAVGDNWIRSKIASRVAKDFPHFRFVSAVHPSAQIARDVQIGDGTVVMAGAVINMATEIGRHCIVNTAASIDHDGVLGDFASVAPGCTLGGNVRVGEGSAVSLGAKVIHGISIGRHTVVGAGAVVVQDIVDNTVAYGVPAKVIRSREASEKYL